MCFVGIVFMAFGPSYSYSLIRLLYGKKWSDGEASTVLRYYCFYAIALAMNGNSPCLLLLNFLFINDIYRGLL
jgi:oligosaccharide translocation protein RFT1